MYLAMRQPNSGHEAEDPPESVDGSMFLAAYAAVATAGAAVVAVLVIAL
jgi:hypothetical protein